ncbi:MAG: PHP domain-containing protein [bacterium]|nr:PHP domain-containing protein [bacterium]MDT8367058.1 PHP domain-containing protein [bacterium]
MIDLHTHSNASDGKLSPAELMRHAHAMGIQVIALTDHDTLSGLAEASEEAAKLGIELIPGIEISAENNPGTLHMLGYFVDPSDAELVETLSWLRGGRDDRNHIILSKLAQLGCPLQWDEVAALAGGESMGRPHIATAMVNRGYVATFKEAFDRYLGKGAAAYADRDKMTPEFSIERIRSAGGLPVLAHPQTLSLTEDELSELLSRLASMGLAGVEAYYYSHSKEETALYCSLARKYGLILTGGSDFHGPGMLETRLGVGVGNLNIPRSVADDLKQLHQKGSPR